MNRLLADIFSELSSTGLDYLYHLCCRFILLLQNHSSLKYSNDNLPQFPTLTHETESLFEASTRERRESRWDAVEVKKKSKTKPTTPRIAQNFLATQCDTLAMFTRATSPSPPLENSLVPARYFGLITCRAILDVDDAVEPCNVPDSKHTC